MSTTVSIIIPTYNRGHVLGRAIESVLCQSFRDFELIVIDDGSTDQTERILKNYPRKLIIHKQENRGVSAARNAGIKLASAPYLAFLDSDDWWLKGKLGAQLKTLEQSGNLIIHTDEVWIRNGKRVNQCKHHAKKGGWIYESMLPLCAMSPSSILFHRSVLDQAGLFDESFPVCEDYDLWLRLTSRFKVDFLETAYIVKTGGHDDQLSRSMWGMDQYRVLALGKALRECPLDHMLREKTVRMMEQKATVYINGCLKREKKLEAQMMLDFVKALVPSFRVGKLE